MSYAMYLIILKKYDSNYSKFKTKNCIKKRKRNKKIKKVLKIQNLVIKLRKRLPYLNRDSRLHL